MIPKYIKLKDKINEEILQGTYPLLSKLPTELELAEKYSCSRATVRTALSLLEEDGIIVKKWGSGNIVIKKNLDDKKNSVALLVSNKTDTSIIPIIDDITAALYREHLQPEIFETKGTWIAEATALDQLFMHSYAGAIIEPVAANLPSINKEKYTKLLKRQVPLVFLGARPLGFEDCSLVKPDYFDKGYQNARFLINRGAEKIGGIFIRDYSPSIEAFSGFTSALRDSGLNVSEEFYLWINHSDTPSHMTRGTASINKFTKYATEHEALIYCDDSSLHGRFLSLDLKPAHSQGKAAVASLLSIKKGDTPKDVTIAWL